MREHVLVNTGKNLYQVDIAGHSNDRNENKALAKKLSSGGYAACIVIGLNTGMSDAEDHRPTGAFEDTGPWKDALIAFAKVKY